MTREQANDLLNAVAAGADVPVEKINEALAATGDLDNREGKTMTKQTPAQVLARIAALSKEDGDCMIWQGALNACGIPMLGKITTKRAAWVAIHGPIPKGHLVTSSCGCQKCVAHLELTTKAKVLLATNSRADVAIRRAAKVKKTKRESVGKINMDIARRIRTDGRTLTVWAAEIGCSISLVSLVRNNKSWVESVSPWAGAGKLHGDWRRA